jgi:integrase
MTVALKGTKKPRTLLDTIQAFRQTKEWQALALSTKRVYEQGFNSLIEFWGDDITKITRPMIFAFKDRNFDTPGKCKIALSTMNVVMRYARNQGWVLYNPAGGMINLPQSTPHKRWTDEEINLFMKDASEPLRLAITLALYTGQRRGDLVKMRWSDYDGETIHIIQQKTGKELFIVVHPVLRAALDKAGRVGPYLLRNHRNEPWCGQSLHQAVSRHAKKIGLNDRTLHGLRKSTASKLAELGCTPHQIMAVTGHSMKEANNYSREANRKILSKQAMEVWQISST